MGLIDRLKAAYSAFMGEENQQEYHRYGIVIGDACYLADSYTINLYDGSPEWDYYGADGHIHGKKYDGWILKEYYP
jgi:hypothetical protein